MKKIIITLIVILLFSQVAYAVEYPTLNSKIVEVYDLKDDKVLYEIDSKKVVPIASLTKIASAITAMECIDDEEKKVTITKEVLDTVDKESSMANLKEGDVVTYKDLLYATLVPSGADATHTLAYLCGGSLDGFVNKMNDTAKKIGLTNTHFANVIGLSDKNHYSTADDVRRLLVYALKNPLFREIYTTKDYQLSNGLVVKSTLYKYNISPEDKSKILGSKTGHTDDAGYCLSALSNIHGHEILTITLKAQQIGEKYYNIIDGITLIDFLNENYDEQVLVSKGSIVTTIPVELSNIDTYDVATSKEITKFLPNDYDKSALKLEYTGEEKLSYHNKQGDKIGTIQYYYENELVDSEDVIINQKISFHFWKWIQKHFYIVIGAVLLIIFCVRK